jgi:LysM repeat protein
VFLKISTRVSVLVLFLFALLGTPFGVQAGGVCGGIFVVEKGETLDTIAAMCGTTVSAITAANPGIRGALTVGQVITVPGSNYVSGSNTPVPGTSTAYTTRYNGTYIVQYGDTFSGIASRFGVSINALWAANSYIQNINLLYAGQAIYLPGSSRTGTVQVSVNTTKDDPVHLFSGTAPSGTPKGEIRLSNQANADVYVSLQGTMSDGSSVINEYPVSGAFNVKVPAGRYVYVAWVGGEKFTGQFKLGGGSEHSITFYSKKVVVQ